MLQPSHLGGGLEDSKGGALGPAARAGGGGGGSGGGGQLRLTVVEESLFLLGVTVLPTKAGDLPLRVKV